MSSPADF